MPWFFRARWPLEAVVLLFHQPSFVTVLWVAAVAPSRDVERSVWTALAFDVTLRLCRGLAVCIHELAHLLAIVALRPRAAPAAGASGPLLWWGLCGLDTLPRQLAPLAHVPSACVHAGAHVKLGPVGEELVRSAGLVMSLVLVAATAAVAPVCTAGDAALAGAALAALGALLSDLPTGPLLGPRPPTGSFCCGNWGCMVPRSSLEDGRKLLPQTVVQLLCRMLDHVELRGAQAGGCNVLCASGGNVVSTRSRSVKTKRGHLATELFAKFGKELRKQSRWAMLRCKPLRGLPTVLAQGHSRFGTSSAPAENETHPHQWIGSHPDNVWQRDPESGRWEKRAMEVCVTITHNGDFDAWQVYDDHVPNGDLGHWLTRIHYVTNTARGDSPKMAGIIDLLLAQGQWTASVKCAFVFSVMHHVEEACGWCPLGPDAPNEVPTLAIFAEWARMFEQAFEGAICLDDTLSYSPETVSRIVDAAVFLLSTDTKMGEESAEALKRWFQSDTIMKSFCEEVVNAFFQNDLLAAVWWFFSRATGTFGCSFTSTVYPNTIVLAAKGQPMSIGFDTEKALAIWSSEPSAIVVPWPSQTKGARPVRSAAFRWDLHDASGEAVELTLAEGGCAEEHLDRARRNVTRGTRREASRHFILPDEDPKQVRPFHLLVRGCDLDPEPAPLMPTAFNNRLVKLKLPPPLEHVRKGVDTVAADISDVPGVLADIDKCWVDARSLNRQSGEHFARCLSFLLSNPPQDGDIDVLIFGVENSLWLGQQFAADMARVFPRLNIVAMSSNWVLGQSQDAHGHMEPMNWAMSRRRFNIRSCGIALAISQSGTTYPTVWATRLLARGEKPLHLFALSANFDTVLANSLGQNLLKPDFACTLFSTLSGVRPAEPSTAATIAMHHTLTHMLLFCAERTLFQQDRAAGRYGAMEHTRMAHPRCELDNDGLLDVKMAVGSLARSAEAICGATVHGNQVSSAVRDALLESGRYLASHLMECYYATLLGAIYVYITVTMGVPFCTGTGMRIAGALGLLERPEDPWPLALGYVLHHLDAHMYVFLAALLASAHRWFTGRRLWTRYTARGIVVVDSTVNYKLLRAYVSKLRALAFRFTSFGVAGQNGSDHFVHEMTHLAHSDVILAVGRQDGRLGTLAPAEATTIMSVQQARFISAKKCGSVEAMCVGHNPFGSSVVFSRQVVLPSDARPDFLSPGLLHSEGGLSPADCAHRVHTLITHGEVGLDDTKTLQVDRDDIQGRMVVAMLEEDDRNGGNLSRNWRKGSTHCVSQRMAVSILQDVVESQAARMGIDAAKIDVHKAFSFPIRKKVATQRRVRGKERMNAGTPESTPGKDYIVRVESGPAGRRPGMGVCTPESTPAKSYVSVGNDRSRDGPVMGDCTPESTPAKSYVSAGNDRPREGQEAAPAKEHIITIGRGTPALIPRHHSLTMPVDGDTLSPDDRDLEQALPPAAPACSPPTDRERAPSESTFDFDEVMELPSAPTITADAVMAAARSRAMKRQIARLQWGKRDSIVGTVLTDMFSGGVKMVDPCFHAWSRLQQEKARIGAMSVEVPAGEWRMREEFRVAVSRRFAGAFGHTVPGIFTEWAKHTRLDRETAGRGVPPCRTRGPIGSTMLGKLKGKELLRGLAVLEGLYETRVAAAERLLAFFVMFHTAVLPLTKAWPLQYAIDRSESRLRVASTPAPVPFVEELPAEPEALAKIKLLQKSVSRRRSLPPTTTD